jgi:hypothetical protein
MAKPLVHVHVDDVLWEIAPWILAVGSSVGWRGGGGAGAVELVAGGAPAQARRSS